MIHKNKKIILLLIIALGFILRFCAAASVPINWDEEEDLASARKIFFSSQNLSLRLVRENLDTGPIGTKIVSSIGWRIFGDSLLAARLPFVIFGTMIIFIVYLLVKSALGIQTALFSAFLLSISQFDIGMTRYADPNTFLVFFTMTSLFFFYKSITRNNTTFLLLSGLSMGIGFWFKESAVFLMPIYIIFLLSCDEYKHWFKNKYLWISFGITLVLILPNIYLVLSPGSLRIEYIHNAVRVGLSINAIAVYLGELILLLAKYFPEFYRYIIPSLNPQFPMVTFVLGIAVLIAIMRSIPDKRPFIRLLVIYFLLNFLPFMFLRGGIEEIDSFWCMSNLDWSILNFIPGVILTANMLVQFNRKFNWAKGLIVCATLFMLIRIWGFVNFPLSYCFPAMDHSLNIQLAVRGPNLLKKGEIDTAKDIFERVYSVSENKPYFKKKAAFRLAEISIKQGKHQEARKYLYYILSQNAHDESALGLLNKL